jgi:cell division protein FtsL
MAAGYRTYNQRTTGRRGNDSSQFYVYGNAVRQAEPLPKRVPEAQPEQRRQMSRQVAKNRHRAKSISPAYAVFLAAAAVCAVLVCMVYLSLQSEVVSRSEKVTAMQEQLADLTEANDTAYNAAADSVNLVTVRDRAMNELGMVPEAEGSVVEYDRPSGEYVKQYSDIPESGVLAKSSDASK